MMRSVFRIRKDTFSCLSERDLMQLEGGGNKKDATRVERTSYGENVSRNGLMVNLSNGP